MVKLEKNKPVWSGPSQGITQSLLSRFLTCRERFRLLVVEGLKEEEAFSAPLEYGNMWHVCEEYHAQNKPYKNALMSYAKNLSMKWTTDREEIDKWYNVCLHQFPVYVEHWKHHPDVKNRTPVIQEKTFAVPYKLPSGRIIVLRGKFDSIDVIDKGLFIQENKTKSDYNKEDLAGQMGHNLQTMMYLIALDMMVKSKDPLLKKVKPEFLNVKGVRYNVIRRPLSEWRGEFCIKQRKGRKTKNGIVGAETKQEYYSRLASLIKENADHFFLRLRVDVSPSDLVLFRIQTLNPILEQLCDWWEWVTTSSPEKLWKGAKKGSTVEPNKVHFRYPFGVYNPLNEGRKGSYYDYLRTGSTAHLEKVSTLFPELEPA